MTRAHVLLMNAALALSLGLAPAACGDAGAGTSEDATSEESATTAGPDGSDGSDAGETTGGETGDASDAHSTGSTGAQESDTDPDPPPAESAQWCFEQMYVDPGSVDGPDYDQFDGLTVGSHCKGTNHQEIWGVERVVFLGDSVTVGSPPTPYEEFYRATLADKLAERFGIEPPTFQWKNISLADGQASLMESGAFASCAKWGARTDDTIPGGPQLADCFPEDKRDLKTLVVMTVGGNDIANAIKDGLDGVPLPMIWDEVEQFIDYMRETVEWFVSDPQRFPSGVYVVFANMYEYTDGTGDLESCPAAPSAGFEGMWEDPAAMREISIHANEQFVALATETSTDIIFMFEHFCGHGYHADDPESPCYRGPGEENWFDLTCTHPTPTGHGAIDDLFFSVIAE